MISKNTVVAANIHGRLFPPLVGHQPPGIVQQMSHSAFRS